MIKYKIGNIFESNTEAIVNTVNTVGIMGKGIALGFKKRYPENFKIYAEACKIDGLDIGILLVTETQDLTGKKIIINFPTKKHWRNPSEYEYIEKGAKELVKVIKEREIKSIAIPPLGAGNGGLNWAKVRSILETHILPLRNDCDFIIYEPNNTVKETLKNERVKLTDARAMLLYMLFNIVENGEFISEFSSEKVCYFLQRFGAKDIFKLKFQQAFYGPYSNKVKRLLSLMNGSYLTGFANMDKRAFEPLSLIMDSKDTVSGYLNERKDLKKLCVNTNEFLTGFYSTFGLELLSTIDFIILRDDKLDSKHIKEELKKWSSRKSKLFKESHIDIAIEHLRQSSLYTLQ